MCNCAEMDREPYNRDVFVRQLGDKECARRGCVKGLRWRVIHGKWNLQTLVCNDHLRWALELEQLTQSRGIALGWEPGYPTLSTCGHFVVSYTQRTAQVTPTMQQITQYGHKGKGGRRLDYNRPVAREIGAVWPPENDPRPAIW